MIAEIFLVTLPGFALGAVFMALANRRVGAAAARARWLKLAVFFLIVHVVLGVASAGHPWIGLLVMAIVVAGTIELQHAWQRMPAPRPSLLWPMYVVIAGVTLAVAFSIPPEWFAILFLVTAAGDGFAQVVGQLCGRHKLAPRVSPGKTVEGFVGGLVAALSVALLARGLLHHASVADTFVLATLIAVAGLAGDLTASWVKRRAGLKDYSDALPGQGGFLDRFDSLLGALALVGPVLAWLYRG